MNMKDWIKSHFKELKSVEDIKSICLSDHDLDTRELPEWMGRLTNLTSLDLSGTNIRKLPEWVEGLTSLIILYLSYTNIHELPEWMGGLTNLTSLYLSGTKISELPKCLGELTNLTSLSLAGTNISGLPEWLGGLTNLIHLSFGGTNIRVLPESLGKLTNLTSLDLSSTKISVLPECIYALPLRRLNLSELRLETISEKILDLGLEFVQEGFGYKNGINLKGTKINNIDVTIFKKPRQAIELFFAELKNKVLLNEARIIFVGDGAAGKSTIIQRIITSEYQDKIKETRGVQITHWRESDSPDSPKVAFWDFGGQAIMHSMHEFFLGERCLYVVVLDGRRDERPEYWLDIISQYGASASVMVVMNKTDQNPHAGINEKKLRRDYSQTFKKMYFHRISCVCGEGFEDFKEDLAGAVKEVETCREVFPKKWYNVKIKLTEMKGNHIREEDYRRFCRAEEITKKSDQDILLKWMHDLGVCFHYKSKQYIGGSAVNEIKVLRPEWITNGVYKVITSKEAGDSNGFLPHSVIAELLEREDDVNPAYPSIERDFILGMMRDFMLSSQIGDSQVGYSEFIPMLTMANEPDLPELKDPVHLQIEYTKPIPAPVLYSFIVSRKDDVQQYLTWRHGTFLSNSNCQAIVRFGRTKSIIDIYVSGKGQSHYLAGIRESLLKMHAEMEVKYAEYVFYEQDGQVARLELDRLLGMLQKGEEKDYADDIREMVNIHNVLVSFAPEEIIRELTKKLRSRDAEIEEMKKMLFSVRALLAKLETLSPEQMRKISENETNAEIKAFLCEILPEIQKGNSQGVKEKLLILLGMAGSVASLAPYIEALLRVLSGQIPQ